jgi:integrase
MVAYERASQAPRDPIGASLRSHEGSISAALASYYESSAFRSLTGGTPRMRRGILERFRGLVGDRPLCKLPQHYIVKELLDKLEPHAARSWLKALRHFLRYCVERGLMDSDPTQGIKLKVARSDGIHSWTEGEIAQYETHHPIGSKARLALALGLFTAQRRGDVIRMGRQHVRNGALTVRQQKTGAVLALPLHPELLAILDEATPSEALAFLVTNSGRPYGANDFSEQFRAWCNTAKLPEHCSFHGLRKAALTRLAEAGCTTHEIAAISGHRSLKEVERYTRAVDQARLAREAMGRVATVTKLDVRKTPTANKTG